MSFRDHLQSIIRQKNSLLCVGLDPVVERMPEFLQKADDPIFQFNKAIIDATADLAAAFKLNLAFYEAYGLAGWQALQKTFDYLPADVIKIADAKRGDIGNTSRMYAKALFEELGADAVTVNPLMGHDSVRPFLEDPERGVFVLCLTSNPGSADLQRFSDGEVMLFHRIIELVNNWNERGNCGLVVGATHPNELAEVRRLAPDLPLLIPGIGAQGGDVAASVQNGTDANGENALFNSSRAILYASSGRDFAHAAREEARRTRDQINRAREK